MSLSPPQIDAIILSGGLDQITPTLSLKNGVAREAINFECSVSGGYSRIAGYERFDGHASPTDASNSSDIRYITVASYVHTPTVGETLASSSGASATVAYISGLSMVITKSTGTWAVGNTLTVGVTSIGTVTNIDLGPATPLESALVKNAVADIWRASIAAVPGSGPIRGVVEYNDVVYAMRNNANADALAIYKSSSSGWTLVPYYKMVSFTAAGATAPAEGATLAKGGVTAVIKRVVLQTATTTWATNSAAGYLILTTLAGGHFSSGAATIGAINLTLSGAESDITMLPGGRFEFDEYNFYGQSVSRRLYGCDGVNKGFEFDGDVLVPIITGAATDTPAHVVCHKGYLWFALGSSVMYSMAGSPYIWSGVLGAGEIATGDTVTGMISMPGGTASPTLGIFSRNNTSIFYGTPSDTGSQLISYNTGTGAMAYSVTNMAQTFAFDDRGLNGVQTAMQYGNFNSTTLTNTVLPFINERINLFTGCTLNRRKSQYRAFYSDGYGLYVTVVNGKLLGCMPVYFPNTVTCCYEGKTSTGVDLNLFGSSNGYVYQLDKGTSFDGTAIDWQLQLNYANAKGPRTLKRYRIASIEVLSADPTYIEFSFGYSLGYDSGEYSQPEGETSAKYIGNSRWDSFTWDNFFWDTTGMGPINAELGGTAENIAMMFTGSSDYVAPFTFNSVLIHYSPRRMMRL